MIRRAPCGLALALGLAAPALALEHEVVIDHAAGPIAADYRGSVMVEMRQIGGAGVSGRPSTLRCVWTASLEVERVATLGPALRSQRTLSDEDVMTGSRPGWCPSPAQAKARLVDLHGERLRAALLALVEADRAVLIAEADTGTTRS